MLEVFQNKNIHIIGATGAEGAALALFLPKKIKADFTFHDFCEKKDFKANFFSFHDAYSVKEKEKLFAELLRLKEKIKFKKEYLQNIETADFIFVPQSWFRYPENKILEDYRAKFYNITKLYLNLARCSIFGVTGTLGKSTTSSLIAEIIAATGKKVLSSGNERHVRQYLEEIPQLKASDSLVLEISNRQLMLDLGKSPNFAVITNIVPNHLDDHGTFENYVQTKQSIYSHQCANDFLITSHDSEVTNNFSGPGKTYFFSLLEELEEGAFLRNQALLLRLNGRENRICEKHELKLQGEHNLSNVLAASLTCFLAGVPIKIIRQAILNFKNLEARLQFVGEKNGVWFYNDSKSCNPEATAAAIRTFKKPLILIAGGSRKKVYGGEFEKMAEAIIINKVKGLVLIGEKASEIRKAVRKEAAKFQKKSPLIREQQDFIKAFKDAFAMAEKGDVVLFSPGCESFGMFKDYRERARVFNNLVSEA